MEQRSCAVCGNAFMAQRPQARFCGATCRKRASRGGLPPAAPIPITRTVPAPPPAAEKPSAPASPPAPGSAPDSGPGFEGQLGLISAVVSELTEANRLNTALGQQALRLAVRMETSRSDTGAAIASLSKELRAVMHQALAAAEDANDPVDDLRARRDAKRGNAAAG